MQAVDLSQEDIHDLPRPPPEEGAAALPHLRERRRRQEHAHRPAAARHQDDLRGPARRGEARQREGRHHRRRRDRPRPADRRPEGRARAGHHHRRRVPLFLDRPPQVHHRRHARPRAVHPQHGHRRLDVPAGRHPHRRPPRRHDPDPPALVHRVAPGHPARRRRHQQDGPRRLLAGRLRADQGRLHRLRRQARPAATSPSSRCRR